jgi:DUF3099 family protein
MNRYFWQMGIRMACFLGAIFLADGWLRWVLLVGAVVLPYSAVLFANAGRDRVSYDMSPVTPQARAALPPASAPGAGAPGPGERVPVDDDAGAAAGGGRVIDHVDDGEAHRPENDHDGGR